MIDAGGAGREGRLLAPAHRCTAAPTGSSCRCLGGAGRRRRAGRHRAARPRHLRRAAGLGDRPRPAVPGLRLLVAPRPGRRWSPASGARPTMVEDGIVPELLLGQKYGHALHFWDLAERRHLQTVDLGAEHQMVLELRPAHDPEATYGFVGVVVSIEDLSASIWLWYRDGDDVGRGQGDHDPGRAGRPGAAAARCCRPSGRCRRWSPTSTSPSTTACSTSPAGAPASSGSTTCPTRSHPREVGLGAARRHRRRGPRTPRRRTSRWRRAADGRGEPRRPARLRHQLALRRVGRPVLPGRRRRAGWRRSTRTRRAG